MSNNSWADKGKAALSAVPTKKSKSKTRPALSGRHEGRVESAEPMVYSTGSFGVKFTYIVESRDGAGYKVYENVVLKKADGTPTLYGEEQLKRRLQAAGLSSDEINRAKMPETADDHELLSDIVGAPVVLILEIEEYLGKPYSKVRSVYQNERA